MGGDASTEQSPKRRPGRRVRKGGREQARARNIWGRGERRKERVSWYPGISKADLVMVHGALRPHLLPLYPPRMPRLRLQMGQDWIQQAQTGGGARNRREGTPRCPFQACPKVQAPKRRIGLAEIWSAVSPRKGGRERGGEEAVQSCPGQRAGISSTPPKEVRRGR